MVVELEIRNAYLPWPTFLVSDGVDHISKDHDEYIRNHGNETHFRFTDAVVSNRKFHGYPI